MVHDNLTLPLPPPPQSPPPPHGQLMTFPVNPRLLYHWLNSIGAGNIAGYPLGIQIFVASGMNVAPGIQEFAIQESHEWSACNPHSRR